MLSFFHVCSTGYYFHLHHNGGWPGPFGSSVCHNPAGCNRWHFPCPGSDYLPIPAEQ
jgi:hypothetical protein